MAHNIGKEYVDGSIKFALATIPQEELQKLFSSLGYDTELEEINLELVVKAWDECGEDFSKPFFALAQDQLDDEDKMRQVKRQVISKMNAYSRADGKTGGTSGASFDETKWKNSQSIISFIFGLGESGYKTYAQTQADANAKAIEAESAARAAEAQAMASQNITKWALIGGSVLVGIIVIVALVLSLRKR